MVRLGLVGIGGWAPKIASQISMNPNTVLYSVSTRNSKKRHRFAASFNCRATDSYAPSSTVVNLKLPFKGHYRAWKEVLAS